MDLKVWMYLSYLVISIGLVVWVAGVLSRNGLVFLVEVFDDSKLAKAINSLLVVGFYLLNLGFAMFNLRYGGRITSMAHAMEELSLKIGLMLLVLGILHFFNVFALNRYRRGRLRQQAPRPPVPPAGRLAMAGPYAGGPVGFPPGRPPVPPQHPGAARPGLSPEAAPPAGPPTPPHQPPAQP
ncbi:hypothetical protein [Polymorphospora sp. NPDC050346]|uniref:hypothetical protein n=1 Tax=Polymorphospora sp. NPDC050346 TaxID=3155780 RepID=UPI0033C88EA5